MNDTGPVTLVGMKAILPGDEIEHAQQQYDKAMRNMLTHPSRETIDAFTVANAILYEIQDLYRIGRKLLYEYHRTRRERGRDSQDLHTL